MARIVVLFLICFTAGCSSKLAYRYADWAVERQLFQYLELDRSQRKHVKAEIDRLHHWHRYQELPKYLAILDEIEAIVRQDSPVQASQLVTIEETLIPLWFSIVDTAGPFFIDVLSQLTPDQQRHLQQQIENGNKDELDEYVDLTELERREKAEDNMKEAASDFLGKLKPEQMRFIEQWAASIQLNAEIYQADRLAWQKRFFLLMSEPKNSDFTRDMAQLFNYRQQHWTEARQQAHGKSQALRSELFAQLLNLASPKQKEKLLNEIEQYQTLCADLSATN